MPCDGKIFHPYLGVVGPWLKRRQIETIKINISIRTWHTCVSAVCNCVTFYQVIYSHIGQWCLDQFFTMISGLICISEVRRKKQRITTRHSFQLVIFLP